MAHTISGDTQSGIDEKGGEGIEEMGGGRGDGIYGTERVSGAYAVSGEREEDMWEKRGEGIKEIDNTITMGKTQSRIAAYDI